MFTHRLDRDLTDDVFFPSTSSFTIQKTGTTQEQEAPSLPEAWQSHSLPSGQRDRVGCQDQGWLSTYSKGDRDVVTHAADEEIMSWEHRLCFLNAERCF